MTPLNLMKMTGRINFLPVAHIPLLFSPPAFSDTNCNSLTHVGKKGRTKNRKGPKPSLEQPKIYLSASFKLPCTSSLIPAVGA